MPKKPLKPCKHQGCHKLTEEKYCYSAPSREDASIKERIKESGRMLGLGIKLIEHIIIGNYSYCSLKEKG